MYQAKFETSIIPDNLSTYCIIIILVWRGALFYDSHCHLQDNRIIDSIDALIQRANEVGVSDMLCCGTVETDWDAVLRLHTTYHEIHAALGLHPWSLRKRSPQWAEQLSTLLEKYPSLGIGETGIDHMVEKETFIDQKEIFEQHLVLAKEFNRPISIHCRKAWGELIDSIKKIGLPAVGAMIHAYCGPPDMVLVLEKLGLYISFSGSVTHSHNVKGKKSVAAVSPQRLLIETDAPDVLPEGINCEHNEPAFLVEVANTVAQIRGVSLNEIKRLTYENACRLFC